MAIREILNKNAWIGASLAGLLIVIAIIAMVRGSSSKPDQAVPGASGMSFYTTDDGATWFADRSDKAVPFKKDGKDAVRAYVYRDASGKEFVSHVERYTAEARQAVAALESMPPEQRALEDPMSAAGGMDAIEVKRPQDKAWVRVSDPRGQRIMQPPRPTEKPTG